MTRRFSSVCNGSRIGSSGNVSVAVRNDVAMTFLRANDSGGGVWKMIATEPIGVEANGNVNEFAKFGGFFDVGIHAGFEGFEDFVFIN